MLNHLKNNFAIDRGQFDIAGDHPDEAGILIAVTDNENCPDIVLTLRADHLNSHSGEVAFPGGKWEPGDRSLVQTALRESEEEIALPEKAVEVINVLPPMMSRFGIKVTPFVGIVPHDIDLIPNPAELSSVFRVPLQYFLDDRRTRTDVYFRQGTQWWSPVYHFEDYKIWGLTSKILVDFMNSAFDANIGRENDAPEYERKPLLEKN